LTHSQSKIEEQKIENQSGVMTAQEWYEKGNAYRKQQQWHEAINCYMRAAELDPESPAVEAKKMLDDIMAFYCKDMYNP
jgi:outer membrane protein assembly factor BamD (BamD/ComL family)